MCADAHQRSRRNARGNENGRRSFLLHFPTQNRLARLLSLSPFGPGARSAIQLRSFNRARFEFDTHRATLRSSRNQNEISTKTKETQTKTPTNRSVCGELSPRVGRLEMNANVSRFHFRFHLLRQIAPQTSSRDAMQIHSRFCNYFAYARLSSAGRSGDLNRPQSSQLLSEIQISQFAAIKTSERPRTAKREHASESRTAEAPTHEPTERTSDERNRTIALFGRQRAERNATKQKKYSNSNKLTN